jgi:hypothetical protein
MNSGLKQKEFSNIMNWYKKAEQWYRFAPTITLYHGTTEDNLRSILKEGFKPFSPDQALEEILQEYGFSKNTVPEWIWKYELEYRKQKPYIFFTTSKKQAKAYASKSYGEFKNSIVDVLKQWKKEQGVEIKKKTYKPVIITIDVPWKFVQSDIDLKNIYQNIINHKKYIEEKLSHKNKTLEDYLSSMSLEFFAKNPIPTKYITNWEYA